MVIQNDEIMGLMLPTLRADFEMCARYAYHADAPLNCDFSIFGGYQDKEISHDDLFAWKDQTLGSFTLRMLPGNHFFLHNAQSLLLQMISRQLESVNG